MNYDFSQAIHKWMIKYWFVSLTLYFYLSVSFPKIYPLSTYSLSTIIGTSCNLTLKLIHTHISHPLMEYGIVRYKIIPYTSLKIFLRISQTTGIKTRSKMELWESEYAPGIWNISSLSSNISIYLVRIYYIDIIHQVHSLVCL